MDLVLVLVVVVLILQHSLQEMLLEELHLVVEVVLVVELEMVGMGLME